jgi:hypothetical protein
MFGPSPVRAVVLGAKGVENRLRLRRCTPTSSYNGTAYPWWGCGYTYGFRVPFLVVSAYTSPGTISGFCTSGVDCVGNNESGAVALTATTAVVALRASITVPAGPRGTIRSPTIMHQRYMRGMFH